MENNTEQFDKIFEQVVEILNSEVCFNSSGVKLDKTTNLKKDLYLDSLDSLYLIVEVEKKFGIVLPDEKVATVYTLEDLCNLVNGAVNGIT